MNYHQLKKLDEETLSKLSEGLGPSDECICSILSPPEGKKKGIRASIKNAFASLGSKKQKTKKQVSGGNSIEIPLTFTRGERGVYTTKMNRKESCGKCGCDKEAFALRHSYANIRISTPDIDVASICPCPSDCMPELKEKLQNNIQVTVERMSMVQNPPETSQVTENITPKSSEMTNNSEPNKHNSENPSELKLTRPDRKLVD